MWRTFGFVALCCLASVLAAPTVHLVKVDESEDIPDYQQLLPTDLPPIVDPVWMTVTMKPLVKTTIVEPLNPQYPQTSEQPVQPDHGTSYQQPIAPTWQPSPQSPPATYYPYYYGAPTDGPRTSLPNLSQSPQQPFPQQHQQQYPYNVMPQFQYHYQSYPQLSWKPAVQPQQHPQPHATPQRPCGGAQQAYQQHLYLQRGY
uniref:Putative conserved secreted protein n=1 Tax=Culex tarsalis TaxID=7177 RepID=A0A1Q3FNH6_CULTA